MQFEYLGVLLDSCGDVETEVVKQTIKSYRIAGSLSDSLAKQTLRKRFENKDTYIYIKENIYLKAPR